MWDACKLLWSLFLGLFRPRASLEAENLALRQQIIVLRRSAPNKRLSFNALDRLIVPFGVPNPRLQAKRRVDEVALCDDID
jgi:hypothetical protein